MDVSDKQLKELNDPDNASGVFGLYMGLVLAINDPHQMERVRVLIYGIDEQGLELAKYRWVPIMKHMTGVQIDTQLGPGGQVTEGLTSYGQTGVHKIGTIVCVQFLGGMISNPVIVGALHQQDLISGLPGGNLGKNETAETSNEDIQPTKENLDIAFGTPDSDVKATRGFEVTARASGSRTGAPDVDADLRKGGDVTSDRNKPGYPQSRRPTAEGFDNEPTMFSFTTPGQHTVLMNDDKDNCRIRVRTVEGNQIILDDTNDRIYISTSQGDNYIEMDGDGHIDIYSASRISIHSEMDINLKSDQQVNIEGVNGINLKSKKDIKISTEKSINVKAGVSTYLQSDDTTHIKTVNLNVETDEKLSMKAGKDLALDGANVGINAKKVLTAKGTKVDINGGSPSSPDPSVGAILANEVNRSPLKDSNDWRSIGDTGVRKDSASLAQEDQTDTDLYPNRIEGGLDSKKRRQNWRK